MNLLKRVRSKFVFTEKNKIPDGVPKIEGKEHLDLYWSEEMARILETWGEKNAWHEIDYLMAPCRGRVLDIACGTGRTIAQLSVFQDLEVHGCDISDYLIQKATQKGISSDRLVVCDATQMPYEDRHFDYSFSIGSLEHFRDENREAFIREAARVTRTGSFHQIPTARDDNEHGWISTFQSYYNNPVGWWLPKFEKFFRKVIVLRSLWEDSQSIGRWFLCYK
jgi:ubiquinone/menaquinone biosynthesis C-methylase UbiE